MKRKKSFQEIEKEFTTKEAREKAEIVRKNLGMSEEAFNNMFKKGNEEIKKIWDEIIKN